MDHISPTNVFQQARQLVAEADRKLEELAARFEDAFDFSKEEKEELRPHPSDHYEEWTVELAPKSTRALFLLTPRESRDWGLSVIEGERAPLHLGFFKGGTKANGGSRRLRAARLISAIGDWVEEDQPTQAAGKSIQSKPEQAKPELIARTEAKAVETKPDAAGAEIGDKPIPVPPRWLDMVPGGQEIPAAVQAKKEAGSQAAFGLGKIFGH